MIITVRPSESSVCKPARASPLDVRHNARHHSSPTATTSRSGRFDWLRAAVLRLTRRLCSTRRRRRAATREPAEVPRTCPWADGRRHYY